MANDQYLYLIAVYDVKFDMFMQPILVRQIGDGIRSFYDSITDPKHPFFQHPEDYQLWSLQEVQLNDSFSSEKTFFKIYDYADVKLAQEAKANEK